MAPDAFRVTGFDDYAAKLRRARVMLDPAEREAAIRQEAANLAFARGWEIVPDDGLMTELAGLVEWPVPLMGVIEDRFLSLPPEVLPALLAHEPDPRHRAFLRAAARLHAAADRLGADQGHHGAEEQADRDRRQEQ